MKLTKKRAIAECKELWAEIEKSGLGKSGFLETEKGKKWEAKNYLNNCPLCEYDSDSKGCSRCPLKVALDLRGL